MIIKIKKIIGFFLGILFKLLPLNKKRIVFINFNGNGYGDNPKYIAEELANRRERLELIWLVREKNKYKFPTYIKPVNMKSIKRYYYLSTAKVIVNNARSYLGIDKRTGQIYLQTWHAPFTPKYIEKDAENKLFPQYVKEAKHDGTITDAILANSLLQVKQYKRTFWLNKNAEILTYGLPRNDYLVNNADNWELKDGLRAKLGIRKDSYVVLYAPTFRDDGSIEGYQMDFDQIKMCFENKFKKDCIILIKLHPNIQYQNLDIQYDNKIKNVSLYPDSQELAVVSDCLISDYSTFLFDFMLLDRPAFIFAIDLEQYKKTRGLLDEFFSFPFPFAKSNDELLNNINEFDIDSYHMNIKKYVLSNPFYDTGDASSRVADWIIEKIQRMPSI